MTTERDDLIEAIHEYAQARVDGRGEKYIRAMEVDVHMAIDVLIQCAGIGSGTQASSAERADDRTGAQRDPDPSRTRSAASLVPSVGVEELIKQAENDLRDEIWLALIEAVHPIGNRPKAKDPRQWGSLSDSDIMRRIDALIAAVRAECQRIEKKEDSASLAAGENDTTVVQTPREVREDR